MHHIQAIYFGAGVLIASVFSLCNPTPSSFFAGCWQSFAATFNVGTAPRWGQKLPARNATALN
jgi:hypothetical protein